jgi:hypothetical protein
MLPGALLRTGANDLEIEIVGYPGIGYSSPVYFNSAQVRWAVVD